jgi:hypothetical protein
MVNIISTHCYYTKVLNILIKQLKFKTVYKRVKQGVFELLNAVNTHFVKWIQVYVIG